MRPPPPEEFDLRGIRLASARVGRRRASFAGMTEERRLVTILFADVVGSTSLGESLDPEDVRALLGRLFAIARDAVEQRGGRVEKFIGDAIMAVFGLPIAHDDD